MQGTHLSSLHSTSVRLQVFYLFSFHYTSVHMSTTTHRKGVSGAENWGNEGCLKLWISKNQHLTGEIKSFSRTEQTTNKSHKYATPIKIQFCALKEASHPSHKWETQTWCRVHQRNVFTFGSNETIPAFRTHTRRNKKLFFTFVLSVSYFKIMHQLVLHGASKSHFLLVSLSRPGS